MTPATLHALLDRAAEDRGEQPAITAADETITYTELVRSSRRLAAWLAAGRCRRGDRVVVALPPSVPLAALLWAIPRAGAAFCVMPEGIRPRTLDHVLDDCEPALLVTEDPAIAGRARARGVRVVGAAELDEAACRDHPAGSLHEGPLPVDPVALIYTSGSTAMPKAVVTTHQQAVFAVEAIQSQLRYLPDDVVYCPLPLSFDYGLYQLFLCAAGGAHVWLGAAAEAGPSLVGNLQRSRATVLPAVPVVADALARLLERRAAALPLRLLTNTGSAMPPDALTRLRRCLPGLRVQLMFGLTECKRATIMPPDEDLRRPGACGRALPGTEVFAVDGDGRRLPPGEVGEVVVRGPHVMAGYWRRPEETAERFPRVAGLFPELHTGDLGWLDTDGYLYFAGRIDDQYKQRGFRVSAAEVEAAACRIPGVRAAAVVPPGDGREEATLFVVGDLAGADVAGRLRDELEDVKVPARCFVLERFPLNANGKVAKRALVTMLAEGGG